MESCLRGKNRPTVSNGRRVRTKECDKQSKTGQSPIKASNTVTLKSKVTEACAKLINKVIPKDDAPEDKSRSAELSPGGDDLKRALKSDMGWKIFKTNGEGCIMAQSLKPKGESFKRSINTNIGGIRLNPNDER